MIQKQPSQSTQSVTTTKYQATKSSGSQSGAQSQEAENPEKLLETNIKIDGTALNDLQVAAYIEQLTNSNLLDNVALVESIEYKVEESTFRHFKLTAMLARNVHLTKEDVEEIRSRAMNTVWNF